MLNEVVKHVTMPKEWKYMKIKSIYKGKGNKKEIKKSKEYLYNEHTKYLCGENNSYKEQRESKERDL